MQHCAKAGIKKGYRRSDYSSIEQNWSDPPPRVDSDFLGPMPETELPFCAPKDVGESENTIK